MSARGRLLARAGNARLRIRNNSALAIDDSGLHQRRQRQNHRGGVATGIRDHVAPEQWLRDSTPAARKPPSSVNSAAVAESFVLESVHRAILRLLQPPGAAQIDDAQSVRHRLGHQRARGFMRRRQKKQFARPAPSTSPTTAASEDSFRSPRAPERYPRD